MGGGHHTPPDPAFNNFRVPHVLSKHNRFALTAGAVMWVWVLYRMKNDYKTIFGLEHPWDHHHGGDHNNHNDKKH